MRKKKISLYFGKNRGEIVRCWHARVPCMWSKGLLSDVPLVCINGVIVLDKFK